MKRQKKHISSRPVVYWNVWSQQSIQIYNRLPVWEINILHHQDNKSSNGNKLQGLRSIFCNLFLLLYLHRVVDFDCMIVLFRLQSRSSVNKGIIRPGILSIPVFADGCQGKLFKAAFKYSFRTMNCAYNLTFLTSKHD